MREDRVHQFFLGRFQIHGDDKALNEFGNFGADHVSAQKLAGLPVEDRLDETLILAERDRFSVGAELEAADTNVPALGFGLLFSEADRRDLRVAIGAAGDFRLVERMDAAKIGDLFHADDTLVFRLVGKHGRTGNVADGV